MVAGSIQQVPQADNIVVAKGDLASLKGAIRELGADDSSIGDLDAALAEDTSKPTGGLSQKAMAWIQATAAKVVSRGTDIGLDVAKSEITKMVMQYYGLS